MTIGELLELYVNGALNIKYEDEKSKVATLGGVSITLEQADLICKQLGWTEYYRGLSPFEIIDKTAKFIRAFKNNGKYNIQEYKNIQVDFINKASSVYGKTFDRIHIQCRNFNMSILYNMPGNTSAYVIYDSFTSVPIKKCRNMRQVVEFIDGSLY